ncbi:MAG: hypothetical protein WD934_09970 [Gemmatimonadales bacterium]
MRIVPLLTVVAALACDYSTGPVRFLDLELRLAGSVMHADSSFDVRVTAINRTGRPQRLETMGGCVIGMTLEAPGNAPLGPGIACRGILEVVHLAHRDSIHRMFRLTADPVNNGRGFARWPAGEYVVRGVLVGPHAETIRRTAPQRFVLVCRDPAAHEC